MPLELCTEMFSQRLAGRMSRPSRFLLFLSRQHHIVAQSSIYAHLLPFRLFDACEREIRAFDKPLTGQGSGQALSQVAQRIRIDFFKHRNRSSNEREVKEERIF